MAFKCLLQPSLTTPAPVAAWVSRLLSNSKLSRKNSSAPCPLRISPICVWAAFVIRYASWLVHKGVDQSPTMTSSPLLTTLL
ncbi:hypothetical protein D3C78_1338860 [compost metagenome]